MLSLLIRLSITNKIICRILSEENPDLKIYCEIDELAIEGRLLKKILEGREAADYIDSQETINLKG